MRKYLLISMMVVLTLAVISVLLLPTATADTEVAKTNASGLLQAGDQEGCLSCHEGIESIRAPESNMMKEIAAKGECTTCHGGDPTVTGTIEDADAVEAAHTGAPDTVPFDLFYPDPGSIWVAGQTCGQCHPDYDKRLERSLMNTEAGKIQGNLWAWGISEDRAVRYGNYDVSGSEVALGTDAYKNYMHNLMQAYPDQFPQSLEMLLNPTPEEIEADPKLAGFTYQRQQCQRCHVGVKGRAKRGDWRGMGCSACHIPYGHAGLYEGDDPTIPKDEPGHLLVHEIQATREARNGIPTETCVSCHNRGKRIGVSYQGMMEFPYGTPFDAEGNKQPKLHTKYYLFIKEDLHHEQQSRPENPEGGLLCQDCHTTIEMHGDGTIPGTTLGQVEIECADCHGTPKAYPWELPLGYGEEYPGIEPMTEARGLGSLLDLLSQDGTLYPPEKGYLLTARGNPFGDIVLTNDDKVVVHSASGKDFFVPLLKDIAQAGTWKTLDGDVAMDKVSVHMDKLECYACHADWAPQCYGCHVDVNYGEGSEDTDWVSSGNAKLEDGTHESVKSPGKVSESRSYLRWEEPILGINGEGRVTPLMPGCQVIFTVRSDETTWTHNEIGRTPPNTEGAGPEGQRGMDMAPVQPHTSGRKARTCESCHSDPKALGYGIEGGRFLLGYDQPRYIELNDSEGNLIPENAQIQMQAIPDLPTDLSQIVDPETGEQLMTVGSHWPDSGPLTADQRTRMERTGVCMGCHQNMADPAFWNDKVVAKFGKVAANEEHINAMNQVIQASVQPGEAAPPADMGQAPAAETDATETAAPVAVAGVSEEALAEVKTTADDAAKMAEEAKAEASRAMSTASEAKDVAAEAKTMASEADAKASEVEAAVSDLAEAPTTSASTMTLWVVIALVLGLLFGGGVVYFANKKEEEKEEG